MRFGGGGADDMALSSGTVWVVYSLCGPDGRPRPVGRARQRWGRARGAGFPTVHKGLGGGRVARTRGGGGLLPAYRSTRCPVAVHPAFSLPPRSPRRAGASLIERAGLKREVGAPAQAGATGSRG
jgi:hypothetical protein